MRVAVVHDCLTVIGGAEKVLGQILRAFPSADLFAVMDHLPCALRPHIGGKRAQTTFIQKLPLSSRWYRYYLPLMPLAIEQLDLSAYDVILSSSYAVAKGVITSPHQLHVCYCYSPLRYAWDMQQSYLEEIKATGLKGLAMRQLLHKFRLWDVSSSHRVNHFVAISHFIAKRIQKAYRRDATVIYPGVELDKFVYCADKRQEFYLTASRFSPYKKIEMIVDAFSSMPDKQLIVIGEGADYKKIAAKAGPNVSLLGFQPQEVLNRYMREAKAFIFAALEDFGIVPIEAQACGTPVIAFGKGGALETVRGLDHPKPTGCFFYEQTVDSLKRGIELFERNCQRIFAENCRENAERFSDLQFRKLLVEFVWEKFNSEKNDESDYLSGGQRHEAMALFEK